MSLINANLAMPVNAAIAPNVLSDGSIAFADSQQDTPIDQRTMRKQQEFRALTKEGLSELAGEELPERAAMSLFNANVATR